MPDLFFYRDPDEVEETEEFAALETRQTEVYRGAYEEKAHVVPEVTQDWDVDHEAPTREWALEPEGGVTEVAPASWGL